MLWYWLVLMVNENTMREVLDKVNLNVSNLEFIERCFNLRSTDKNVQIVELNYVRNYWTIQVILFDFFETEDDFKSYLDKIGLPRGQKLTIGSEFFSFIISGCIFSFFKTENLKMKKNHNLK